MTLKRKTMRNRKKTRRCMKMRMAKVMGTMWTMTATKRNTVSIKTAKETAKNKQIVQSVRKQVWRL